MVSLANVFSAMVSGQALHQSACLHAWLAHTLYLPVCGTQSKTLYIIGAGVLFVVIVSSEPLSILLPLLSVLLGASVLVSSGMRTIVMSLVFVVLMRPYDAGDLVSVGRCVQVVCV